MATEQYSEDDLPWGAAAVPAWWVEVTPHNVMDYGEIERELRRELARIGITPPPDMDDDDGALLADTGAGPYSLPGFKASDGITDASFIAPGDERWYITSEGYFYSREDPDVRYTPSQMVESGHLPPGMDSYFEEGWDRARARSTTPAGLYAREEGTAWERPDWLKKKLRSTDQGMALRSPGSFSEPPSPAGSNHESTSRTPSESPVPSWQLKRQQILKDKADAEEATTLAPPQLGQAVMDESVSTASTLPPWKRKKSQTGGENDNHEDQNRGRSSSPEWKKKQRAMSQSRSVSPKPYSSWRNKNNDDGGDDDANVPEWKRKHAAMARSRSSSPSAPNRKEEDESAPDRGNMKKQYEEATSKQPEESEDKPVPGRGNKVSQYEAAAAKHNEEDDSKPVVPGRGNKKSAYEAAMARNRSSSPAPPIRKPSSAWRKKADEFNPPWKTPETKEEGTKEMPAWKKKQQEAKEAREKEEEARMKEEEERKKEEEERKKEEEAKKEREEGAKKEKEEEGDPRGDPEAIKLVAQGFVLKLLAIEDDAARAKELRNTIAPTKQNNHKVLVKPDELLTAFAYHAQIWKTQEENQEKVNHLRQVAIIARLVIMKLYGANSTELTHFQEGLRPAFA